MIKELNRRYKENRLKQRYGRGSLRAPEHQTAMTAFARAEASLTGAAHRRKIRDVGIGLFRTVVLLAAVLPPNLPLQNPPDSDSPDIQVYNTAPEERAPQPVSLNVRLEQNETAGSGRSDDTRISIYEPMTFKHAGVDFLISARDLAWYRTELGEDDVFWALPNGNFFFRVEKIDACSGVGAGTTMVSAQGTKQVCGARLHFEFDTNTVTRVGQVPGAPPGKALCTQKVLPLGPAQSLLKCTYSNDGVGVTVMVKPSEVPTEVPNKVAFDVKWCPTPVAANCPP
jgi:hypothetical protein